MVVPLYCGRRGIGGRSIELYHSILQDFYGRQNGVYLHLSLPIWRLDPAMNFPWSVANFLLFGRPLEWAL